MPSCRQSIRENPRVLTCSLDQLGNAVVTLTMRPAVRLIRSPRGLSSKSRSTIARMAVQLSLLLTAKGLSHTQIQLISGHATKKSLKDYQHRSLELVELAYHQAIRAVGASPGTKFL